MKIRRIDFYASDWLDGTEDLTLEQRGVYITLCALIYSRQRPVAESELHRRCHGRGYRSSLQRLIELGKVQKTGDDLSVERCAKELERATTRIQTVSNNGQKGGRPTSKNNGLQKPTVSTYDSQQATANNQQEDFKNSEGDAGRSAPARKGAQDVRPPTEEEKAEVAELVEQTKAALTGTVPKAIRDPAAYKAAVTDSKFRAVYRAVNEAASTRLDGAAREEAWRVVAAAQEAGSWAAMSKPDRKALRALWQWSETLEELEPLKEAAD